MTPGMFSGFDSPELRSAYPITELAYSTHELQSQFAEQRCKDNHEDRYFLDVHFKNFEPYNHRQFHSWTVATIGNLAYLAIHCPFSDIRSLCIDALSAYQIYLYDAGICV